jgi:RHS repeat-associated protein
MKSHVAAFALAATVLAGWTPARSSVPLDLVRGLGGAQMLGIPAIPTQPKPFSVPAQPIVAASTDGYLPSSWEVTPKGALTMTLPLAVPPGRAGMAPALSLTYASDSGSGIAGVGWSVSGFSTITRGGRTWASHGTSDGVDYSVRDRFYLDGEELVGVDATPYGGNGAEYRTAMDTFVRVRSTSTQALDPKGPEQFTVELGDGRVRTYGPVEAQQIAFDADNTVFAHGPVRAEWRIVSEQDASGNTIAYEYQDTAGAGGANASDYWYESVPAKIFYTANLTQGAPTHGVQDLAQRYVAFEYENRPDPRLGWLAGVQRRHSLRLKTLRMYAPNPTATALVWQYNLGYTQSGSQRSLLASAQRCEAAGGCLWAKQFTYSPAAGGALFQAAPVQPAPIAVSDYDLGSVSAAGGEVPAAQWLDLNGDGASDLLFGPGANTLWERKHYPAPFDVWLPDGKYLGGAHSLWLSTRDAGGAILPLSQGVSLARDEAPLASAHYGHVRLDESTGVDLDGDGQAELVAVIDNLGAHEVNNDPNLPPLDGCSFADLKWTAAGFVRMQAVPCTVLGTTGGAYTYYLPNEFPTLADVNGDGLPDRLWPYNAAGWIGSNNPNDEVTFEYAPAWQVALNETAEPGRFGPPVLHDTFEASPGVVTDLDGDGRAELTSEALKSSLAFDDAGQWARHVPDSVHQPLDAQSKPLDGYREFGDFNGDGTEDLLRLTQADPARPGTLTGQIFWNTGHGFYADSHLISLAVDVHPDTAQALPTRFADPGIHVTDVDGDGRMDVVIFNNDHKDANQQPAPQIVFLYAHGDGTFGEVDLPVGAGTRDDVKFWLDNTLRPITFYPQRLENDRARLGIEAFGHMLPGSQILLALVPFEDYLVAGGDNKTPGMAAGWNLATLTDTNGDGAIDIVRHVGGNDPSGGFEVLQQQPQWGDALVAVTDEATAWPVLSVDYASTWSDRPEVDDSYTCVYPLRCPKGGLRVVRAVTSRAGVTDLAPGEDPMQHGHTWRYAYRDPIAHQQGLGFFGFSEVRVWDAEASHPVETITTFDLRTPDPSGAFYPGVGRPATITRAQPILPPGQGLPSSATARLVKSTYAYETRVLNGGATHAVFPQSTHRSEWEQKVAIDGAGLGPDHLHVSGYAEPASPPIHVDAQTTFDDYGNVVDALTHTAKGLTTEVQTAVLNDTVHWQLGLVSQRAVMTKEGEKNAVPVWQTSEYTYTSKGQLDTLAVEKNAADPTLASDTTFAYDDYGLLTAATTTVAGEAPRTQRIAYTTAWPGAPDEHLFASVVWSEHDNALCAIDCRPAAWLLAYPAYGLPIASMDRNGVEALRIYDAHGRPVGAHSDGALPVSVAYAGRPDAFGGFNGLQATASSGAQQRLETFDGRGAPLRSSFVGFDGQWIHTFATYDALGRQTATSRPSAGPPTAWTTYDYDSLGRHVATTFPDGSRTTRTFSLLETEQIDPAGHYSYQIRDVDGRLTTSGAEVPPAPGCGVCLAADVKTTYQYTATPTGAVAIARDDEGHATETQYDRRDRPVKQDDPSRGTTTVTYNGFGEPKATVHVATGETETETYDDLGRVLTTTTPDGLTTYSWDLADHGIGRLARAMSPDQIRADYRYDALGRTSGIDQTDAQNPSASLDFAYDAQTGRLAHIDYPKAPGQAARFRAHYDYNGYGYLTTVSDATPNQPAKVLQQILARNADLALVDAVRGLDAGVGGGAIADHRDYDPLMGRLWSISAAHANANRLEVSYNYDADGLVNERTTTDETVQIDETFEHDALHRLTHSTRNGMPLQNGLPFSASVDETYDSVGNRIDTRRNGALLEHRSYGGNGQPPYALTERAISDPANPNQPPQLAAYQYDALGRLKHDPHRTLDWTAFDLPRTVTRDGQTWTFRYGAGHERVRKSGPDGTTTYLAGLYETHQGGPGTRHVFHVVGSDEAVADVTYTEAAQPSQPGTIDVRYPLTDALGSTDAVADAHGTVAERDYYDLWGQRSRPDGTPIDQPMLFQSLVGAGFTSQEHDDALGLVNMQGRMYDAVLGRFLSPDPIVGNPAFSQSWNAYSYVNNSPLNFTDPSGFECTAAIAVANASEKNYIASAGAQCSASNNYTAPGGEEATVADASRVPEAGALISTSLTFIQDQQKWAHVEREIRDIRRYRNAPGGSSKQSADGTPIGGGTSDSWGWQQRSTSAGNGLAPPRRVSPQEVERAKIIADGGSFNPDGSFAGYSRGVLPIGTDDLVEDVIGQAGPIARLFLRTIHGVDVLADDKKSTWTKLRNLKGLYDAVRDLLDARFAGRSPTAADNARADYEDAARRTTALRDQLSDARARIQSMKSQIIPPGVDEGSWGLQGTPQEEKYWREVMKAANLELELQGAERAEQDALTAYKASGGRGGPYR